MTFTQLTHPKIAHTLEAHVGHTPLLRLTRTAVACGLSPSIELYAKAEWFNPSGSVKDRAALWIMQTAEEEGKLWPGMTLFDSTSGNMGIAYAMLGIPRGYKIKLVLPDSASPERIAILRQYGVDLVFSDGKEGSSGALRLARQMAQADPSLFYANQYDNMANWLAYYHTMAPEIWQQTHGRITHFIAGLGSAGTFMGTTLWLKQEDPAVQCISIQPETAHEGIKGMKHMATAVKPAIYDETAADANITITRAEAEEMAQILARQEGLLVGPSAAAAVAASVNTARQLDHGAIVTVLPDNGLKYLSQM